MFMEKLLTIVVPVYKVEPYINKCLDSLILSEELMEILEVIIVNDGTPDNSAELSREYTKKYPNTFRQIDKENGGHGSAWNVGVKEATGKYLRFLDSDDWLTNLDILLCTLEKTDVDVILTHLNNYNEAEQTNTEWNITDGPFNKIGDFSTFTFDDFRNKTNTLNFLFATYKTAILKGLPNLFMEKTMYDDSILYAIPILFADTYLCLDIVLYNYLSGREGQSMNAIVKKRNIPKLLNTYLYEMEFITKNEHLTNNKESLYRIMASDSIYLLNMLVYLPWRDFKKNISLCSKYFHLESIKWKESKQAKRFSTMPLLGFYLLEKIRQIRE